MMAVVPRPSSALWQVPGRCRGNRLQTRTNFVAMGDVSMPSRPRKGDEDASPELHAPSSASQVDTPRSQPELRFDMLQPPGMECRHKSVFGRFIAREALLDEEFWTAAWLRAETHWEDRSYLRHVESYKRKFAEQEFTAIKRRCSGVNAEKCTCIVVV